MSDQKYPTLFGSVEFEPETKDVNGKQVTQFQIKLANNSAEPKVRITVWPELTLPGPIKKGDFVAVGGKFTETQADDGRRFSNLSANYIAILSGTVSVKDGGTPGVARKTAASSEPAF